MTQLEHDIEMQINRKLVQWFKDSTSLCDAGQLSGIATASIIMRSLMWLLLTGLMQKGASLEDVLAIVSANWSMIADKRQGNR